MSLFSKTLVISTSLAVMSLSGCSTISNMFSSDDSYRDNEGKMVESLDMPPNLFNPGKSSVDTHLASFQAEQDAKAQQEAADNIPYFKAKGVSIQSNLSERWLEVESIGSDDVWSGLKRYFKSAGYSVAEERKDIGLMKTEYLQRSALVPLDDVGPITRMLNSWRPELAEGVYDKFTARVETDEVAGKTRIYFSHNMLFSPDANEARNQSGSWKIKPYSAEMEAQALYQAMIFFGSSSEQALAQLKVTDNMVEVVDGTEFDGLSLRANLDASWGYLQSMIYRANWQMDKVSKVSNKIWVQVPKDVQKEDSFASKLAFWRESSKQDLPDVVVLQLTKSEADSEKTLLTAHAPEGEAPLNPKQRKYVFESLGLLAK